MQHFLRISVCFLLSIVVSKKLLVVASEEHNSSPRLKLQRFGKDRSVCGQNEKSFFIEFDSYYSGKWNIKDDAGAILGSGLGSMNPYYGSYICLHRFKCYTLKVSLFASYKVYYDNELIKTVSLAGEDDITTLIGRCDEKEDVKLCDDNQIAFRLELLTDDFPWETSWEVKDCKGEVRFSGGSYDEKNTNYIYFDCIDKRDYHVFTVKDSFGDGMCCGNGNGSYKIFHDNKLVKEGGQFSDSIDEYSFDIKDDDILDYCGCIVSDKSFLGDGECDHGKYNSEACKWDFGDCLIAEYPKCHVYDPSRLNDGDCDLGEYNTAACGCDGGSCADMYDCPKKGNDYGCRGICPTTSPTISPNTLVVKDRASLLGDSFVQGGKYSNINYGSEPYIMLNAGEPPMNGVLTFGITTQEFSDESSGLPLSFMLKLYVSNVDTLFSRDVTVSRLKPSGWNESIVSDSNLDKTIAKVGQTIQVTRRHIGQWIEFDVSDLYVAGAPALPLFLEASIESSDSRKSAVWFGSRESTNPSRLEIVFEVGLDPTTSSVSSFEPVSLPTMLPSSHPTGDGAAIINNGVIVLGVNDEGSLLVPEDSGNISDVSVVGLRLKRDEQFYDGISPNDICDSCEGFGISYISGEKTYWGGVMNMKRNIETENFIKSEDSATAIVKILQDPVRSLRVTHTFQPAIETQNLYRISITLENISNETQGNLRYRRVTLWTIPSTPEQTCISTFFGSTRPKSLELVSNQLRPVNPQIHVANNSLFSCLDDGVEGCVLSSGPGSNLASLFQFHFMNIDGSEKRLASNEALSFEMFYGAAINKEEADHAIAAVQGEIASYSYAPVSGVCDISSLSVPQSVFIIGFRGLNGTAIL